MLPLDLHVLGLPLAFILSQDQTLRCKNFEFYVVLSLYYSNFTLFFLFFSIFQRTYLVIFRFYYFDISCDVSTIFSKPQIFFKPLLACCGVQR